MVGLTQQLWHKVKWQSSFFLQISSRVWDGRRWRKPSKEEIPPVFLKYKGFYAILLEQSLYKKDLVKFYQKSSQVKFCPFDIFPCMHHEMQLWFLLNIERWDFVLNTFLQRRSKMMSLSQKPPKLKLHQSLDFLRCRCTSVFSIWAWSSRSSHVSSAQQMLQPTAEQKEFKLECSLVTKVVFYASYNPLQPAPVSWRVSLPLPLLYTNRRTRCLHT